MTVDRAPDSRVLLYLAGEEDVPLNLTWQLEMLITLALEHHRPLLVGATCTRPDGHSGPPPGDAPPIDNPTAESVLFGDLSIVGDMVFWIGDVEVPTEEALHLVGAGLLAVIEDGVLNPRE